jgi:hypothetical protein
MLNVSGTAVCPVGVPFLREIASGRFLETLNLETLKRPGVLF